LYASPNIVRVNKLQMMRNACKILVGKPERNISLGRLRHRWEDI
jgi:hypothetical protein